MTAKRLCLALSASASYRRFLSSEICDDSKSARRESHIADSATGNVRQIRQICCHRFGLGGNVAVRVQSIGDVELTG